MKKRIVSLILSLVIVFSSCFAISFTPFAAVPASSFSPRLTAPSMTGYYANYWSNNCTRYVCCRVNEILGYSFFNVVYGAWSPAGTGTGANSIYSKLTSAGFQTGSMPKPGAVMVTSNHIAVVEAVNGSSITWTEGDSFTALSNSSTTSQVVIDGTRGTGKSTALESGGTWFALRTIGYNTSTGKPYSGMPGTWYGYVYLLDDSQSTPPVTYSSVRESSYKIENRASGKYLNAFANAGQAKKQTNVCASNGDGSAEQNWKVESIGNDQYLIRSQSNSSLFCLDIATYGMPANGTNVYLYENSSYASKHWYFESTGDGYYIIRSVLNDNFVLAPISTDHRANVQVQTYNGGALQQWKLIDLNPVTEPTTQPVTEPTTQPVTEPTTQPVTEPTTQPVTEPTTQPVTEPTTQPVTQPTTQPVTEPITQPVTEPTTQPTTEVTGDKLIVEDFAQDYVIVLEEELLILTVDGVDPEDFMNFFKNPEMTIHYSDTYVGTGSYLDFAEKEYYVIVPDDINGDGKITAADARLTLRASASLEDIDILQFFAADVDGNERITASDARSILRTAAGLE